MKNTLNKKGFTLIELSATMVILGVIMLIAYPTYIKVILEARKDAFKLSVENILDTVILKDSNDAYKVEGTTVTELNMGGTVGVSNEDYDNLEIKKDEKEELYIIVEGDNEWDGFVACGYAGKIKIVESVLECGTNSNFSYTDEQITDMIQNQGYIPVATLNELDNVRNNISNTFGSGTKWSGKYVGGLDKKYVQVKNIDMSSVATWDGGKGWLPIGTRPYECSFQSFAGEVFSGIYDGAGKVIGNLYINRTDSKIPIGLFSTSTGDFKNITLSDVFVASTQTEKDLPTAALVGQQSGDDVIFSNIRVSGNITTTGGDSGKAGGFIGQAGYLDSISFTNCSFDGNVTGAYNMVGGLVGDLENYNDVLIDGASIKGNIVGGDEGKVGGLIGTASYEFSSGEYDSREDFEEFAFTPLTKATHTYYTTGKIIYSANYPVKTMTYTINLGVLPMDINQMMTWRVTSASVLSTLDDFQNYITNKLAGEVIWPAGDAELYITDPQVFMDHSVKSNNMQIDKVVVDCTTYSGCSATITETISNLEDVNPNFISGVYEVYVPIKFEAEFSTAGFANSVIIKNTSVDASIISDYNQTGGLVGRARYINSFLIENTYVEGDVSSTDWNKIGGLVGEMSWVTDIDILNAHHEGKIVSPWNKAAGLVGEIQYFKDLNVNNSYHIGDVTSEYNKTAGLFGTITWCGQSCLYEEDGQTNRKANSVTITNSYSKGNITGLYNKVSGIVGSLQQVKNVLIDNVYHEGTIEGAYNKVATIVGNAQSIDNLTIKNVSGKGDIYGWQTGMGGIVGNIDFIDNTLIENAKYAGNIILAREQDSDSRYEYFMMSVGGIIGKIGSDSGFYGKPDIFEGTVTIKDSHATGILNGWGSRVGGIVGNAAANSLLSESRTKDNYTLNIENSSFVGTINLNTDLYQINLPLMTQTRNNQTYAIAGGIVGDSNNLNISNSYSRGTINIIIYGPEPTLSIYCGLTNHSVGGIAGRISNHANVSNSYSAMDIVVSRPGGTITAAVTDHMKALVGDYEKATVTNSYYDSNVEAFGDVNGMARTTSDLKYDSPGSGTFNSWNTNIWDFGTTSQYPKLKGEN